MNPLKSIARRLTRSLAGARLISPRRTATLLYRIQLGRWPDLRNPRDFNEKILWLEFNTDTALWSELADKHAARNYVCRRGLEHILIPVYGVWDNAADIDFDSLPESFAIKATNGYARNLLVTDKSAYGVAGLREAVASWPSKVYGLADGEPHYTLIPPRILAEKLLPLGEDSGTERRRLPVDYKFMCFGGKPLYCRVCTDRDPRSFRAPFIFYSLPDWTPVDDSVTPEVRPDRPIPKPPRLGKMMEYAAILAEGFPFVRVDLYNIDGEIYFGEMTFTPDAARGDGMTPGFSLRLGELITLPARTGG